MDKEKLIQLTIDGKECQVPEGSTLLQAAKTLPPMCGGSRGLGPLGAVLYHSSSG